MQPLREQPARAECRGLAREHEERGLEGVVRVGVVAEHALADAEDEPAVPPYEGRECFLIALLHEEIEELTIGAVSPNEFGDIASIQDSNNRVGHRALSRMRHYQYLPAQSQFDTPTAPTASTVG